MVPRDAVAVAPRLVGRAAFLTDLGLPTAESGATAVAGIWAAGNVTNPMAQVVHAAAEAATAAPRINADLAEG